MANKAMSLLNHYKLVFGDRTGIKAVKDVFQRLNLPVPEHNEYIETSDNGYLLFLEPYGTTVRFIKDDAFPTLKSDHIMQPLGTLKLGEFRIDINPGLATCLNEDDVDELVDRLRRENIDYHDPSMTNTGWLPHVTRDFPDGYPVVVDAGAARKFYIGATAAGASVRYKGIQDRLFGALKNAFSHAMADTSTESINNFWDACADQTRKGILQASWTWKESRHIAVVSNMYAQSLKHHRPAADLD